MKTINLITKKFKNYKINARYLVILLIAGLAFSLASMKSRDTASVARVGFASSAKILTQLPEWQLATAEIDTLQKQLTAQLEIKVAAYNEKYEALQETQATLNEVIIADKQDELQAMKTSIAKFRDTAVEAVRQKENELYLPILEKVNEAIEETARQQAYTHIFNIDSSDVPLMLFADTSTRVDDLVIARLINFK